MTATITTNTAKKSIEIAFDGKPAAEVREALKGLRFRWNPTRGIWYGFADEQTTREAIENAEKGATVTTAGNATNRNAAKASAKEAAPLPSLWERTRTDDLPAYGTENDIKKAIKAAQNGTGWSYDRAAADYFRKHLKKRFPEVKFSITSGGAGWLNSCDIRIKAAPWGFVEIKGDPEAVRDRDRYDRREPCEQLAAVLEYCEKLHAAADTDDGDYYADYGAHHDLYGGASVSFYSFETLEPTEAQKADAADFSRRKAEHEAAEEERRAEEARKQIAERKREQERAEQQAAEDARKIAEIENGATVEDLEPSEFIAVDDLHGSRKPSTFAEVLADALNDETPGELAQITRRVSMSESLFDIFAGLLLHDFAFFAGRGGTGTLDPRVTENNLHALTAEQRAGVRFFMSDCVGVYVDGVLRAVVDPEGFGYARYTCIPGAASTVRPWESVAAEITAKAADLEPFHIPAPLGEQIESANLAEGEPVTVVSVDGMTLSAREVRGTLREITANRIIINQGRKRLPGAVYLNGSPSLVVFRGTLPEVPAALRYEDVGGGLQRVRFAGESCREYMRDVIAWAKSEGFTPCIDTIAR